MSSECGSCGAAARDGYLCRSCGRQLREQLADLAPGRSLFPGHALGTVGRGVSTRWDAPSAVVVGGLAVQLDTTVARLARIGDSSTSGERPVNFHERAAELRSLLDRTLRPWAWWLVDMERPAPLPPRCTHRDPVGVDCRRCSVEVPKVHSARRAQWARKAAAIAGGDVAAMAAYLLERVNVVEGREEAGAFAQEIHELISRLEGVIDRPAELLAVGECGAELPDETVCQRNLYVDPEETYVTCRGCGFRWSVAERRAWLLALAEDSLGTAATISTALTRLEQPVTADRIYQWKKRGRLKVHGNEPPPPCRDHQGRGRQPLACKACAAKEGAPLYRLGDVVDLLVEAARADVARAKKAAAKKAS